MSTRGHQATYQQPNLEVTCDKLPNKELGENETMPAVDLCGCRDPTTRKIFSFNNSVRLANSNGVRSRMRSTRITTINQESTQTSFERCPCINVWDILVYVLRFALSNKKFNASHAGGKQAYDILTGLEMVIVATVKQLKWLRGKI
jgi:hypothetical protein